MKLRYDVLIYDCDGVILDSIESNYVFYNRIMAGLGRPSIDRLCKESETVLHTYSYLDVIEHFFGNDPQKQQALELGKTIRYRELMPYMRREEGLLEVLQELHPLVQLAVCTNRAASMEMIIDDFGLSGLFSCIMTAGKVTNPKPHPSLLTGFSHITPSLRIGPCLLVTVLLIIRLLRQPVFRLLPIKTVFPVCRLLGITGKYSNISPVLLVSLS